MKDVFDTVSEVQFKSIAAVGLMAALTMGATWWVLTLSVSPSRPVEDLPSEGVVSSRVQKHTQVSSPAPSEQRQPEVIIERGNSAEVVLQTPPHSDSSLKLEDAESRYTVQIGAFQLKDGAQRRMAELAEQGYDSYLVALEESGTVTFRLVVGAFPTYDEASATADDLKVSGIDAFVRTLE